MWSLSLDFVPVGCAPSFASDWTGAVPLASSVTKSLSRGVPRRRPKAPLTPTNPCGHRYQRFPERGEPGWREISMDYYSYPTLRTLSMGYRGKIYDSCGPSGAGPKFPRRRAFFRSFQAPTRTLSWTFFQYPRKLLARPLASASQP